MRGVPESLRDKVAVVEGLGKDAKVVYKRGSDGLITDVHLEPKRLVCIIRDDRRECVRHIAKDGIKFELAPLTDG